MEKSDNKRLSHKSQSKTKAKTKNKNNNIIKVNSILKKRTTMENIPQKQNFNLNNKISIIQNLPIQDAASNYQMQPQMNMFPQQYAQPVLISNQGGGIPPQNTYIINQNSVINVNNINNVNNIEFGTKAGTYLCPNCQMNVSTNIQSQCNCCSFLIFALMMIIFPVFMTYVMCIDIEDCRCEFGCGVSTNGCCYPKCCSCPDRRTVADCNCCCDVEHYCSNCGKLIGTRDSLKEICPPCCRCC